MNHSFSRSATRKSPLWVAFFTVTTLRTWYMSRPDLVGRFKPAQIGVLEIVLSVSAFVIGLFNVVLRPVLVVLTLPVTIVTVGLFLFVINALMFWAAASVLDGFHVAGFGAALLGSLIYSVLGVIIESALGGLFAKK